MGVPAHDQRDFDFANQFSLPIVQVIASGGASGGSGVSEVVGPPYVSTDKDCDVIVNSLDELNGQSVDEASVRLCEMLMQSNQGGAKKPMHRLRDWLFSRQRYWGEPFLLKR